MYEIGQPEIDAIAKVIFSGELFRYSSPDSQCERFERRWAEYVGVKEATMTASGTDALRAALAGLGIGPGDEVIVPACTYMATALAVVAVGAIPVIVDIDESITLDPAAFEKAIGPNVKAVIPVHMWGLPCDMDAIMPIAAKHGIHVVEDACQGVGGAYKGKMLGSFGKISAFSFNYYKNISSGEGGAIVTDDEDAMFRARCLNECCRFYWDGRDPNRDIFCGAGSRASEIEGALMNAQLDRLPKLIETLRAQKIRALKDTADAGLKPIKHNSLEWECGIQLMYQLPTAEAAEQFNKLAGGVIAGKTGRHVYTEWDPILRHRGAHHPAMDPFKMRENQGLRMDYTPEMCETSLDILNRTVMLRTMPDRDEAAYAAWIEKIRKAAESTLAAV